MGNTSFEIDPQKLSALIKSTGKSQSEFSKSLGRSGSYISNALKSGRMSNTAVEFIEKTFGINKELFAKQKQDTSQEKYKSIYDDVERLKLKVSELDRIINQETKQQIDNIDFLTTKEKAILLLKQMTVYGSCEENDFLSKAKHEGCSDKDIKAAKEYLKVITSVKGYGKNKSRWIIRP